MVKFLNNLVKLFLFLLPWQTIWIYREAFINGVKWEYGTLGYFATEILLWFIIVLFLWWYCQQARRRTEDTKFKITKDRIFVLSLLIFISYLFISVIWSFDKDLAFQQALRVMETVLFFLVIFIGPFKKQQLAKWFIYGAIIPSILGIWQFFTQSAPAFKWLGLANHPVWEAGTSIIQSDSVGRWLRAYGSFGSPNVFGGYLVIVLIILLFNYKKFESVKSKAFVLMSYVLCLTSLFFTFSRSAWLVAAMAIIVHSVIIKKYQFIILSVIIFFIFSNIYFPLIKTRTSFQSISEVRSVEERVGGYKEALQIFKQHPLIGVGAGNYTLAAYYLNSNRLGYEYQPVHNALVLFIVEQGVVGLLLFLFVILSLFFYVMSFKDKLKDSRHIVFMFFCFFVLMFFDHYLYSSYVGLMFGSIFFALILAEKENNTNLV